MSHHDASQDVDALRKAMKGMGTDEPTLIRILAHADPLYIARLNHTFTQRLGRNLEKDVKSEVSGSLERALVALLRGPLQQDVHAVRCAVKGMGTNEALLNDVLVDRSNADLQAIKRAYHDTFHRSLEEDVADDLSGQTKQLFTMITSANRAEESTPLDPQAVERDVTDLHNALLRPSSADTLVVCRTFASRSAGQLRAVQQAYDRQHQPSLSKAVHAGTSGHMQDVLVHILRGATATERAARDAAELAETLYAASVKDDMVVERVVRLHWNRQHMEAVKASFQTRHKRDLDKVVAEKTKGDCMKTLRAALE